MNEICKGNPNPRLNTKTKLGRVMKLTSIPLAICFYHRCIRFRTLPKHAH